MEEQLHNDGVVHNRDGAHNNRDGAHMQHDNLKLFRHGGSRTKGAHFANASASGLQMRCPNVTASTIFIHVIQKDRIRISMCIFDKTTLHVETHGSGSRHSLPSNFALHTKTCTQNGSYSFAASQLSLQPILPATRQLCMSTTRSTLLH